MNFALRNCGLARWWLGAALGIGGTWFRAGAADGKSDEEVYILPRFEVEEKFAPEKWTYATCDGFELLSNVSRSRTRLFAVEFASFLRFVRKVTPDLLLPEGTRLSIVLASPSRFAQLVPLFPSPLGYAERPWGLLARSQDTAILVMRYEGIHEQPTSSGLITDPVDVDERSTLTNAQAAYMNDPLLVAHRQVLRAGPPPGFPFTTAIGDSRPFLASHQTFLKSGALTVIAGMGNAVDTRYSFHDQRMRWALYFPDDFRTDQELWRYPFPVHHLPPLENLFAIDLDSPAWSSPLHRLERDAFVHWCLLANGPDRAHAFLDFLARAGPEPVTPQLFAETFGGSFADVTRTLLKYIDSKKSDHVTGLPARNFWNRMPHDFDEVRATFAMRDATPIESARIRADLFRLMENDQAAARALAPRFQKKQVDDNLWITAGLILLARNKIADATQSFQAAILAGTKRPVPYTRLAALKFQAAVLHHDWKKTLTTAEARPIFELLREACARPPVLKENAALLCSLVEWQIDSPEADLAELLEHTTIALHYDTSLVLRAASAIGRKGDLPRAHRLLDTARAGTWDRSALERIARLEQELFASVVPAAAKKTPVSADVSPSEARGPSLQPEHGERNFVIPDLALEMIRVAPGKFRMGSAPDEAFFEADQQPLTLVTISRGFWIGKCEVTQNQWQKVMGRTMREQQNLESPDLSSNGKGPALPIYDVSWDEAVEFCRRLTQAERQAGRLSPVLRYDLPTEAQWEYACRAGTTGPLAGNPADIAWLPKSLVPHWAIPLNNRTFVALVHPVATKQGNAWGIHDMYGNVSEWCLDWYAPTLRGGEAMDPVGPKDGTFRVVRGGSCWGVETGVPIIGSAVRSKDLPTARFGRGFRPVLVAQTPGE